MLPSLMHALAVTAQAPRSQGQFTYFIMMIAVIMVAFYFIIMRPQQRERTERQKMLDQMKKGDRVITIGGIHGRIVEVDEHKGIVVLEVANKVQVKFSKTAVTTVLGKEKEEK